MIRGAIASSGFLSDSTAASRARALLHYTLAFAVYARERGGRIGWCLKIGDWRFAWRGEGVVRWDCSWLCICSGRDFLLF